MASVLAALLKKVSDLAGNEINLYFCFKKDLATLQKSMECIQAVVRDAEQKQLTNDAVRIWVKHLKDVADRAELVLDEIDYEILRRKVGAESSSNSILSRYCMARKIKNINDLLAQINKQADDYKLQPLLNVPIPAYKNEETDSFLDEFRVLGREDDAATLIRSLTGNTTEEKLTIIPIAGMGGIGKTTLAKLVYNDRQIKGHFDVRVWVCVGVKVDGVLTILVQILESLTKRKVEVKTRETVIQSLKEELGGKKFLLVVDDVWNEEGEFWADFRSCMFKVNEAYGNSIIVTTRSTELSTNASQTSMPYSLDQLSDDQCWSIIKERAFPIGGPSEEYLVGIGQEIARRCVGLPLAAKVVGGMLRSKKGVEEWLSVRDSLVQSSSQEDPVLHILKLSYDNLPNPLLKHCFSYCSIFRKDTNMEKAQLIQLWMALGFLEVKEGARHKDMEEVGHEFFKILVQNSLFQDVVKDDYGNITGCKMHDLVHDLALSISGTDCLSLEGTMSSGAIPIVEDQALVNVREDKMFEVLKHVCDLVHHLAHFISGSQCLCLEGSMKNDLIPKVKDVALYDVRVDKMFEELKKYEAGYVRSLFLLRVKSFIIEHISLNHFKCLRILNLMHSGFKLLPDSIGELIHLRYLDLSFNLELDILPKSIGKLYHLQTLRLKRCSNELKLPNEVGDLISLRHLYIDERCNIAPFNIGRFTCLQTLEYFHVGKEKGHCIEVLGPLKNLRGMLKLDHLQNVSSKSEASNADLIGKLGLNNLKYAWNYNNDADNGDVLEGLRAPPNLKVLMFDGYMGENFPEWVMKMAVIGMDQKLLPLNNLVHISFRNCGRCEPVPMLGQLPHLQMLEMWNMENVRCIDESFYGYSGGSSRCGKSIFPALRELKMGSMDNLEMWMDVKVTRKDTIGGGEGSSGSGGDWLVFPDLEVLYFYQCPMINSLPYEALTGAHLSLKRLVISDCYKLGTIPTLQGFTSLEELIIQNCKGLTSIPMLGQLPHLQKLEMGEMENVRCIDESFYGYCGSSSSCGKPPRVIFPALRILKISNMFNLKKWMDVNVTRKDTIGGGEGSSGSGGGGGWLVFPYLEELEFNRCPTINSLPYEAVRGAHLSLKRLVIEDCGNLGTIPTLQGFTSLEELRIENCRGLASLPELPFNHSLKRLEICGTFEKLICIPEGYLSGVANTLEELKISPLSSETQQMKLCLQSLLPTPTSSHSPSPSTSSSLQQQLQLFPILRKLTLRGQPHWDSIPEEVQHLTALASLKIQYFGSVEALPDWFAHLSSLEELYLQECSQLRNLPSTEAMGRLTKLKTIKIGWCPRLQARVAQRSGPEWSKVSHIPSLYY